MRYGVIIADPPWSFDDKLAKMRAPTKRSAASQYDVMTISDIMGLDIASLADPAGCVLALWVPGSFLEAGMDSYVPKPVRPRDLFEAVEGWAAPTATLESSAPAARPTAEAMDRDLARERLGGDSELLAELAGLFLDECPRLLSDIRSAVARQDGKALERAADSLKGSVANFAAAAAMEAAAALAQMGRQGHLQRAAEACAALEAEIEGLKEALADILVEAEKEEMMNAE